jgi:hypothetical protein
MAPKDRRPSHLALDAGQRLAGRHDPLHTVGCCAFEHVDTGVYDRSARSTTGGLMTYVLASVLVLFLLVLAVGALAGRIRVTSCCAPTDPRHDLRMRAAFDDEQQGGTR